MIKNLFFVPSFWILSFAWATSFYIAPFEESVSTSRYIVNGRVGLSYTRWAEAKDQSRRIYTFTEIQIDDSIKGGITAPSIYVRELGGQVEETGMDVPGAAQFKRGEQVVVFLGAENDDGTYPIENMMMGKYGLAKNQKGEEILVGGSLSAAQQGSHFDDHGSATPPARDWTIADLKKLVLDQSEQSEAASAQNKTAQKPPPAEAQPFNSPAPIVDDRQGSDAAKSPVLEESKQFWHLAWMLGGFALLIGIFFFVRRRKRLT